MGESTNWGKYPSGQSSQVDNVHITAEAHIVLEEPQPQTKFLRQRPPSWYSHRVAQPDRMKWRCRCMQSHWMTNSKSETHLRATNCRPSNDSATHTRSARVDHPHQESGKNQMESM